MKRDLDQLGLEGGLIVSCQASHGKPFHGPVYMAAMARAAKMAGAVGIRADAPMDIAAIKGEVDLPVIGIYKIRLPVQHKRVYITPTFEAAAEVVKLGCEILSLHVLPDYDTDVPSLKERISRIKQELDVLLMADIATVQDAAFAIEQGVDIVATTSARYAWPDEKIPGPAIDLVAELVRRFSVPVIAEGHFETPEQCVEAIDAGAYAVVVGAALTAPEVRMARFVEGMARKT